MWPILFFSVTIRHEINPVPKKIHDDEVSEVAALDQAQNSYLKGCVEAFRSMNIGPTFETCLEKAKGHRLELEGIMNNRNNKEHLYAHI